MTSLELGLWYLDAGRIGATIQFRADLQTGACSHGCDQVDNDLVADERSAAPVLCDMAKHTMLDLIPLAGARRKVTHVDGHSQTNGQLLQCHLPRAATHAVAATSIRHDQQLSGAPVTP